MKPKLVIFLSLTVLFVGFFVSKLFAAEPSSVRGYEYVTIRWGGLEKSQIIRPGGKVEFIGLELRKVARPSDETNERAFYMNIAMNGLTKDGYEFAGMTSDEIIMKRQLK